MRNAFQLARIWLFCIAAQPLLVNCGSPEDSQTSANSTKISAAEKEYWVSGSAKAGGNGLSPASAWNSISEINKRIFKPGTVIHLSGKLTQTVITDQSGEKDAPVKFIGDGSAVIKGIHLQQSKYLQFENLEAFGSTGTKCGSIITVNGVGPVQFVTFSNIHLHNSDRGITIGNPRSGVVGSDLTFKNMKIENMQCEGATFEDFAGDRITFDGGQISNIGLKCPWHADGSGCHGVYASGGHHHVFNNVTFSKPNLGWDLSLRRANVTVSNCKFSGGHMLANSEEDGIAYNGFYYIFNNTFTGPGTAIYQSSVNDKGSPTPGNTWSIYNNKFAKGQHINFSENKAPFYAQNYNVLMCDNSYDGAKISLGAVAKGKTHDAHYKNCPKP